MTVKNNVNRWRRRKLQEGAKPLTIWVDSRTTARLQKLRSHLGLKYGGKWPQTRIVRASIKALYKIALGR